MLRGRWQRWSLQARLLLTILLVLAATIVASGLLFFLSSAATVEQQTFALTSNTVSQMTRSVDLYMENIDRLEWPEVTQAFANPVASMFTFDLFISCVALWVLLFTQQRVRHRWVYVVMTLLIGLSFALPMFLLARERAS